MSQGARPWMLRPRKASRSARAAASPQIARSSVDLPAPLAPIAATVLLRQLEIDREQGLEVAVEGVEPAHFERVHSTAIPI